MSWHLFDERGQRVPKMTVFNSGHTVAGWITDDAVAGAYGAEKGWGFAAGGTWIPSWFAAKMRQGYRVFYCGEGVLPMGWLADSELANFWQAASPAHKRLPHIAAVEMWVRHKAAEHV